MYIIYIYISPVVIIGLSLSHGHDVFSITLNKMGNPVVSCQANRARPVRLAPMCSLRAVALPLVMAGTVAAARAQIHTNPAPTYKCGPGKSLPARAYVLSGPY